MNTGGGQNVCMTTDAIGGVWQYALELCAQLSEQGCRITLAVIGQEPTPQQQEEASAISGLRLEVTGQELDWLAEGPDPVQRTAQAISALAERVEADIVHCNSPALAGAAPFPAPVVSVAHGCLSTWWSVARAEPLPRSLAWHHDMMREGFAASAAVVAPSAAFANLVQRIYGLSERPDVVHNGRHPLLATDSATSSSPAVLTVGRLWDEVKNANVLDAVAARLDLPFLAAGALQGPNGEKFAPDHLQSLGHLGEDELAALLQKRPVFVSAATFEPFGLAVLEAAAAGCPLVLSDIPTFRELWDGAAMFVDPSDAEGFAAAIQKIAHDTRLASSLGKAARERARRYTPAASAEGMQRIYRRVVAAERKAA